MLVTAGGDDDSYRPSISADGRPIAFSSFSRDLVDEDINNRPDIFFFDQENSCIELLSTGGNGNSVDPSLGADGQSVVFSPGASILTDDGNFGVNVFVSGSFERPLANPLDVATQKDTPSRITLTGQDVDGDTLTYTIVSRRENGVLSDEGPNYAGQDQFIYTVADSKLTSLAVTFDLKVVASAGERSR